MNINEIAQEIEKLDISERIRLVEDIWDGIARNNNELPLLQWQKKELEKRYGDYKKGNLKLHDCKDVHYQFKAR